MQARSASAIPAQWEDGHGSRSRHTRQRLQGRQELSVKLHSALGVRKAREGEVDLGGEQVVCPEARIDLRQIHEALQEQPRTNE